MLSTRREAPASSTIPFSAGARSQATNAATASTPTPSQARPFAARDSNHSLRLDAYARTVLRERSMATR